MIGWLRQAGIKKTNAELFQQLEMEHVQQYATSSKAYLECPYCLKIVGKTQIQRHIRDIHIHGGDKPGHTCGTCHKTFERKDSLKKHEKIHTGEKPHACHLCDYRSSQSSNLNTHIRTKHRDIVDT